MAASRSPLRSPSAIATKPPASAAALEAERGTLWGLCYRMTGSASDADDLVQETFVRAMERPPDDTSMPWRPWLVRVAMNLARDHLRRRKRRAYHGTWLPTPVETSARGGVETLGDDDAPGRAGDPETRYGLLESASFAFLVAVEALSPAQRAVLVLRDAFDYSSRETADALGLSEENVRVTLHRAKKAMAAYDARRMPPSPERTRAMEVVLHQLIAFIGAQDLAQAASLLAKDARALSDGGGVYHASPRAVVGADKIAKLYGNLATKASPRAAFSVRTVNGVPALVGEDPSPRRPNAPRFVMLIDLDRDGKIREMYSVVAPDKLREVAFPGSTGEATAPASGGGHAGRRFLGRS